MTPSPRLFDSVGECVEAALQRVGREIVLAVPLGIGKPVPLVNEFFRRAVSEPSLKLKIMTALSLRKPVGSSDLERRFLQPFVARVFGNYPELDYVRALRSGRLPANVEVVEFFLESGAYLNVEYSQQHYLSANYTHVAREILAHANVIGHMVAKRVVAGEIALSLSSNPDITLDLLPRLAALRKAGREIVTIGEVNSQLPFMLGDAEVAADSFDYLIEHPGCDYDLFCPPNMAIGGVDHMIGLYASSLVKDGGTLQLGIGELGDAVVYSLQLRHRQNAVYAALLGDLGAARGFADLISRTGGMQPFAMGLYACTEMFVDGFLDLYKSGILKRRVYAHQGIQRGLNEGRITEAIDPACLDWLLECGIGPVLGETEFRDLVAAGLFLEGVKFAGGMLIAPDGKHWRADFADPASRALLLAHCLAPRLQKGVLLHGGFFLGPKDFYSALRDLPDGERRQFNMTSVGFTNQLYGSDSELKTLQRADARFINTTMMVTLLGAAVSDGLDDGRVVSGVGGQYNFVAMAHALPGARSILAVRSTRTKEEKVASNILWNYGHATIPRHLRDMVITEYGIADLRGKTDSEVIAALLNVADSRFQDPLLARAKQAGKIAREYRIPDIHRDNTPQAIEAALARYRKDGLFSEFPFGTDFTAEEIVLGKALKRLKERTSTLSGKTFAVAGALARLHIPDRVKPYLERMALDKPKTFGEKLMRDLVAAELMKMT
jgi:acyl-CoA hydrolase